MKKLETERLILRKVTIDEFELLIIMWYYNANFFSGG